MVDYREISMCNLKSPCVEWLAHIAQAFLASADGRVEGVGIPKNGNRASEPPARPQRFTC